MIHDVTYANSCIIVNSLAKIVEKVRSTFPWPLYANKFTALNVRWTVDVFQ